MRFELNEDQLFLVNTVTQFLSKELPPEVRRGWLGETSGQRYRQWWQQCAALGWTGIFAAPDSEECTSVSGVPLVDAALVAETAGRALAPSCLVGVSATVAALAQQSDSQLTDTLHGVLAGTRISSLALQEPGGSWDLGQVTTSARRDGDDIVVSGHKVLVPDATTADVFLVGCRVEEEDGYAVVAANLPGVSARAQRGLDLLRCYGSVVFDDVRISPAALLMGDTIAPHTVLRIVTCLQLSETVGAIDQLFNLTVEYARTRYAFGRPIGSFQALKHRIANLMLWVETAKGTVDAAVEAVVSGSSDVDLLLSVAKSYVGDQSIQVAQECTQMFGGIGLTYEHDAHLYLRRVTANRAVLGTPEQHRARVARLIGATSGVGS